MTPLPNASQPQSESRSFSSNTRALKDSTSELQQFGNRNTNGHSFHNKNPSITSNPVQPFRATSTHDHLSGQSHAQEVDPMSQTHTFGNDFSHDSQNAFSFDELMTPEYSDNLLSEHTTLQEYIWEQHFLPQDSNRPEIYQPSGFGSPSNPQSPSSNFQGVFSALDHHQPKFIPGSQLLSPQLTNPSPPEPDLSSVGQTRGLETPSDMPRNGKKRGAEQLQVATSQTALNPHANIDSSQQNPISPIVVVSSHQRGDSPARPAFPRARSSSKRGRDNGLHDGQQNEQYRSNSRSPRLSPADNAASLLAPPDQFESEVYGVETDTRIGVSPVQRGADQVSSANDLAKQRDLDDRNADVEDWLAKSETGSAADEQQGFGRKSERPRAHSTGIRVDAMGLPIYSDSGIPGPGLLVDEDSQDEYTDDGSGSVTGSDAVPDSPPVTEDILRDSEQELNKFPSMEDVPPELQEPLPKQFFRKSPWQDPLRGPITDDTFDQPASSNAAAVRYNQEAAKWESASRAATWGTRGTRRLSDSEISSIVDGSRVRHLSLAKRGRERGSTLLNKARGLIPRRSNSNIKKISNSPSELRSPDLPAPSRQETEHPIKPVSRHSSFSKSKPKSPTLDTGSAFLAIANNLAAVGQGSTSAVDTSFQKSEGLRSPLQMLRKVRSKSDVGKSPTKSVPGLAQMITRHGGPPMPTLASPAQNQQQTILHQPSTGDDDDDDDDLLDEVAIKMDFKVRAENIIPNYEGFKIHARQLNPRLEPYLIDRVGQEQVRRYKKLINNKIKHTRAVQVARKCPSGKHCFSLGGEATILPPRASAKDPDATYAQFQITNPADEDAEEPSFDEGVVTPALFPPGIPLPPVKRLPAEFECTLCFKVKKFQKPSDWTKHVHEDVQPFSCTFPHCNEPKSFKRKADWVRHENERHRRLEYWKCSVQECNHICYRKDNFVQHLVREHKKTEPKIKRASTSSKVKAAPVSGWPTEDNEVLQLVETCRFETSSKPRDEPCRFCGNVCSSWKKLSVHMGKHMEQLAMPVLELVDMKEVAPDTVISPIEQNYHQNTGAVAANVSQFEHQPSLSPYTGTLSYQNSSGAQSPAAMHSNMRYGYDSGFYGPMQQGPMIQGSVYQDPPLYSGNSGYATAGVQGTSQYGSINSQIESPYSAQSMHTPASVHSVQAGIPRSQPMGTSFPGNTITTAPTASYNGAHMTYTSSPELSPYQQYSTTAQAHEFQDTSGHMNQDQQYNLTSHPGGTEYMYNVQHVNDTGNNYSYA